MTVRKKNKKQIVVISVSFRRGTLDFYHFTIGSGKGGCLSCFTPHESLLTITHLKRSTIIYTKHRQGGDPFLSKMHTTKHFGKLNTWMQV